MALPSQTRQNYNEKTQVAEMPSRSVHEQTERRPMSDALNWPLVTGENKSKPNLEVNLGPQFEKNRNIFKRLWGSTFDTPLTWSSRNKSPMRTGTRDEADRFA